MIALHLLDSLMFTLESDSRSMERLSLLDVLLERSRFSFPPTMPANQLAISVSPARLAKLLRLVEEVGDGADPSISTVHLSGSMQYLFG
jgi:hypothetical protein